MERYQPTLAHDFIDLAILLPTDKFFVFIGKFDLNANLILCPFDKRDLSYHHHSSFNSIIGAVDGKRELFKANISPRVGADVR